MLLVGGTQHERHGRVRTLDSAEAWDPTPSAFSGAGTLAAVRTGHLAALLGDGSVLIVGGESNDADVESARPTFRADLERWDPLTATFAPAGSLTGFDWVDSATMLHDGRVLIVGSSDRSGLGQAEVWDPATATTTPVGRFPSVGGSAVAPLADGGALIVGGCCGHEGDASAVVRFDPASGGLTPGGLAPTGLVDVVALPLADGRVLVAGRGWGGPESLAAMWDPTTGAVTTVWQRDDRAGLLALPDGRVLVVWAGRICGNAPSLRGPAGCPSGDATVQTWDPATAAFGDAGAVGQGGFWRPSPTQLSDGRVLLVADHATVAWDPTTLTVTQGPALPEATDETVTALQDGRVLVAGGRAGRDGLGRSLANAATWSAPR